jgi:ABC-type multidrug transport system ATPase subunit
VLVVVVWYYTADHDSYNLGSPQVYAIMGPSGAGKTSLLDTLAGRKTVGYITGNILINGFPMGQSSVRHLSAYVSQEDVLLATLTVRETLQMAADLQIAASRAQREREVDKVLAALDLNGCADRYVGGQFIRGVSGGQKRRTSIAMELLTKPPIIFLDEPTSGLDSAAAMRLFNVLKTLAVQQNTLVVATIHQPRSDIFDLFDKLLLLSLGYVVYQGAANEVQSYFETAGFWCPRGWNTADFIIDVIAGPMQVGSDASRFKPEDGKVRSITSGAREHEKHAA